MTEIVMRQTPPILHGPSEKEQKYDRQLRLWATNGQAALESAHILLLNSGSGTVGIETLKNLVLPGVGHFTIVDDAVVSEADLGVNFFLNQSCLGRTRAECCAELLLELNPEVQGDWYPKTSSRPAVPTTGSKKLCLAGTPQDPVDLGTILGEPATFTVILYTLPIKEDALALVEAYGRSRRTPVVSVHSAGFYSYFRVNLPGTFPIVDTHPDDNATTDLRLLTPWEELSSFCREVTKDIESLDNEEHGHLPFVAILFHYLDVWRESHAGQNPSTYAEKIAFRKLVSEGMRTGNAEGGEENFEEAIAAVLKTIAEPRLPPSLKEVFDYNHDDPVEMRSTFWVIADAVKEFHRRHGRLPVPGGIPDMKAKSSVYIKLQNIYRTKARQDATEILSLAQSLPGGEDIEHAEVDLFCKNAAFVKLINATTERSTRIREVAAAEFAKDENARDYQMSMSLLPVFLSLYATSHVIPGTEADMFAAIDTVIPHASDQESVRKAAREVLRAGGGELHNISAVTGGMVAQEMIKIITKQYIPIDNTCIFDGIGSRCQALRL